MRMQRRAGCECRRAGCECREAGCEYRRAGCQWVEGCESEARIEKLPPGTVSAAAGAVSPVGGAVFIQSLFISAGKTPASYKRQD